MTFPDYLILALLLLAVGLALRSIRRQKKGGCCGNCGSCQRHCKP